MTIEELEARLEYLEQQVALLTDYLAEQYEPTESGIVIETVTVN